MALRAGLIVYNVTTDTKPFCTPSSPRLPFDRLNAVVMRWANQKGVDAGTLPLGLVLLYGMKQAYPCR